MGMTAIVLGHVNAVCTLECVHRRQLLAARALNERSLLIIRDVFIDDLVDSLLTEVQRADA